VSDPPPKGILESLFHDLFAELCSLFSGQLQHHFIVRVVSLEVLHHQLEVLLEINGVFSLLSFLLLP
jgi:hypothetical protein